MGLQEPDIVQFDDKGEPVGVTKMQATLQDKDRLTVILQAYHEHPGSAPVGADIRVCQSLEGKEDTLRRRLKIQPGPAVRLEAYYLTDELAGMVIIQNNSKDVAVQVGAGGHIPPKLFTIIYPNELSGLTVWVQGDKAAEIVYYIFPK